MSRSKRSLRSALRTLLLLDEPPERTALAYAIGVFFGFSPLVGLHTLSALAFMLLFRVNRAAVLLGVYTNTPWTYPAMLVLGTALGLRLLGMEADVPELSTELFTSVRGLERLLTDLETLLLPFLVGNFLVSAVAALAAYPVALGLILRYQASRDGPER